MKNIVDKKIQEAIEGLQALQAADRCFGLKDYQIQRQLDGIATDLQCLVVLPGEEVHSIIPVIVDVKGKECNYGYGEFKVICQRADGDLEVEIDEDELWGVVKFEDIDWERLEEYRNEQFRKASING